MAGMLEDAMEPLPVPNETDDPRLEVTGVWDGAVAEESTVEELTDDGATELSCAEDPGWDGNATLEPTGWDDV